MRIKQIQINDADKYCRYLDAQLFLPPTMNNVADGRFEHYLQNMLGITRLPYRISLVDLIKEKVVEPDLFVHLPREYFFNYENFPECPAKFVPSLNEELVTAGYHSVYIVLVPGEAFSLIM